MSDIGKTLVDFVLSIIRAMSDVWDLLNTEIFYKGLNVFGYELIPSFTFKPIHLTGGVLIIIITLSLISLFNPIK